MKKNYLTFLAFLLFAVVANGQIDSTASKTARLKLHRGESVRPRQPMMLTNNALHCMHILKDSPLTPRELLQGCRHLTLDIDAAGFFYDAEYGADVLTAVGFTATGFRLSPTLSYGINEKAQLRVGFNATLFAGLDSLYALRPILSLTYMPTHWLQVIAGTINGNYYHEVGLPLYDQKRWIYNYQEDGLQILTNTRRWNSDTWLDWYHYLTPGTADYEFFTMGTRHEFLLARINATDSLPMLSPWERDARRHSLIFSLPLHFVANHKGGEVNTLGGSLTVFNENIGLRMKYRFLDDLKGMSHKMTLDIPFYFYQNNDEIVAGPNGHGWFPQLTYEFTKINRNELKGWSARATVGWWHGENYYNTMGFPVLFCDNAAQHYMNLGNESSYGVYNDTWHYSLAVEHEFKGLGLGLQVDCFNYDLQELNWIFSFYLRFKGKFLLF